MSLPLPRPLATWSIQTFGKAYNINFDEAEKTADQYISIGDFFVRKLKTGVRPLAESPILHPADSKISQIGEITDGKCIQAKGKFYSVQDLVGGDEALAQQYDQGLFATYYLCPTDYHRVHSPVDGEIVKAIHIAGALWPVNDWSTTNIENLFGVNERVVVEIKGRLGSCLLVFVGATNVGQMRMTFDESLVTNVPSARPGVRSYNPPIPVSKGQDLGAFHMGSTVVMIYPKTIRLQKAEWDEFLGKQVKMGGAFL